MKTADAPIGLLFGMIALVCGGAFALMAAWYAIETRPLAFVIHAAMAAVYLRGGWRAVLKHSEPRP